MMSLKVWCIWRLFVWGMTGFVGMGIGRMKRGQGGPVNVRKVEVTCYSYAFVCVNGS